MARQLRELRARILTAVGAGFALAAASAACAGESSERDSDGSSATGGKGGAGAVGGSMIDSGGASTGGAAGSGVGGGDPGITLGGGGMVIIADGRPFVVGSEARLPEVALRSTAPFDDELSDDDRRAVAARWLESARREHASIAAFFVLSLELLAVGAPAELVEQTNQAAFDEIEHARLAFAIASRFAGHEVVPGALDVSGVAPSADLADIAARAAREGCVLETLGVALALARHAVATDPAVKLALERILRDEARHAELSYRLVAWAIATGGARVREAVARALEAPLGFAADEPLSTACARYGMLDGSAAFDIVAEARRHVVEPAVSALLSAPTA